MTVPVCQLMGVGIGILLSWPQEVQAQQANGVHTSPGHPLIVGRPVTPYSPPRSAVPRPAPAPLARYWQAQDSAIRSDQSQRMLVALSKSTTIPIAFLRSNAYTISNTASTATFLFRVVVQPNGLVVPNLLKQTVEGIDTTAPTFDLLRQEAQRSMGTLRFTPAATQDTIVVPLNFTIQ